MSDDKNEVIKNTLKGNNLIMIADFVVKEFAQLAVHDEDLYSYNGKNFDPLTDIEIGQTIYNIFRNHYAKAWNPQKTKNIIDAIKYHPSIMNVDNFDSYQGMNLMNLNNGVLNLDTNPYTLLPHDKKYLFTSHIPIDYDPDRQTCPEFIQFLKDTFRNADGTVDKKMCETIIQLGGYLLYPQVRAKQLFVFFGNGANGKSILIDNVFSMFFSENSMSSLSLKALSDENNTARGQLLNARVNFATEQKGGGTESDELKKIISGEPIEVKRHYKNLRKRFRPHVKILVSGNSRIFLQDSSHGADRRLLPLDFLNKFVSEADYERLTEEYAKRGITPEQKRIFKAKDEYELAQKFKQEAPAILNLFLGGLYNLRKNLWKFERHESILRAEEAYKEESDPVTLWLYAAYSESQLDFIPFNDIFSTYMMWFNSTFEGNRSKKPLSKILLSKKIQDIFRIDTVKQAGIRGYNLKYNNDLSDN